MATSRDNEYAAYNGATFTSSLQPIAAPGAGKAIVLLGFDIQVIGGGTTVTLLDDSSNLYGARKLAADGIYSSELPRTLEANRGLVVGGAAGGLTLNGFFRYSIIDVGS